MILKLKSVLVLFGEPNQLDEAEGIFADSAAIAAPLGVKQSKPPLASVALLEIKETLSVEITGSVSEAIATMKFAVMKDVRIG